MDFGTVGLAAAKAAGETAKDVGKDKIAGVLGAAFPFWGMRRRAVDAYIRDIENSNLTPEAKMLAIINTKKTYKELQCQMAIADIAQKSAKEGTDFSSASKVEDEWLSRFMDAGRHVSDEEGQLLWGNILAGEFEEPGSTTPSVIRILSEMTQAYARVFSNLCSLECCLFPSDSSGKPQGFDNKIIVPTEASAPLLEELGITFTSLSELSALGLIQFNTMGFIRKYSNEQYPIIHVVYNNEAISCTQYSKESFPIGNVLLTSAGSCISRFIQKRNIDGYASILRSYFEGDHNMTVSAAPIISIASVAEGTRMGYTYQMLNKDTPQRQEQTDA